MRFDEARRTEKELKPELERLEGQRLALGRERDRIAEASDKAMREAERQLMAAVTKLTVFEEQKILPIRNQLRQARDTLALLEQDPEAEAREGQIDAYLVKIRAGKLYPIRGVDSALDLAVNEFEEEVRAIVGWKLRKTDKPACASFYSSRRIGELAGAEAVA